jgi:TIR domain/Anti-sigma-K factor rskA, C-terminal
MTALAQIVAATMALDASWAVSVSADGTIRTWGTGAAPRVVRLTVAIDADQPVTVALSGKRLRVLWAAGETIRLHEDVEGAPPRDDVFPAPERVCGLALSPSGGLAVVAYEDGALRILNAGTGEFGSTLATGQLTARAVAVASDQGPVVAGFPDGSVRRYDLATGTSDLVGICPGVHLVAVTPDGGVVIGAGADNVLFRWKPSVSSLPASRAPDTAITAVATDGTGDKVLAGTTVGRVQLLDFSGSPATELGEAAASGAGFRGVVDNDVCFTVYRPQALSPGVWASLLVFAHKTELIRKPGQAPVDPVKQVEDMARAHLGDMPVRRASEDSRSGIVRGAGLRVVTDLPGIRSDPEAAEFHWQEPVHQVVFRLLAGPELVGSVVRGAVRVWFGMLLLGEVSLAISVTASAPEARSPAVAESAPRYRKIFPSYSHDDRAIVDDFAEKARALGDQYLQDVLVLRSGERWRARLPELIEEADIFQLFWSSNSMRSQYCREEWEHALALRRPQFVRPLYWEDPMPQDPALGLPPVALVDLQFVKVPPYTPPPRPAPEQPDRAAPLADPAMREVPGQHLEDTVETAVTGAASRETGDERSDPAASARRAAGGELARRAPRRSRRSVVPWAAGAAAAVAIAIVIAIGVTSGTGTHATTFSAALSGTSLTPGATGQATLTQTTAGWRVTLHVSGLPRLDNGRFYQAWLKNAAGILVPIGTFNQGGDITMWSGVPPTQYPTITVTRQQANGNPASSGQRVLVGRVHSTS